jgi:glycosyltransferase involved in cell wall biosynthesis
VVVLFPGKSQFTQGNAPENLIIKPVINSIQPLTWYRTASAIIKEKPDIVIFRFWMPFMGPSLGTIARKIRKKNIPVIAIADNIIPHEKRFGDKWLTRYFLKQCNHVMVMSRQVGKDLQDIIPGAKFTYSPHPVYNIFGNPVSRQEAINKLNLNEQHRYMLFFGLVRKYKGLDLLLDGFIKASAHLPDVKLIIAGEFYDKMEDYSERLQHPAIKDKVIVYNKYIAEDEVKYYFSAASLLAQTYRTATQSGVTQIGYHFGIPMLVTNVGGLPEIVKHNVNGYVVEPEVASVAGALADFFMNNKETPMRKEVLLESERFSWDFFVDNLLKAAQSEHS